MESYEVLRDAIAEVGAKAVAQDLRVSLSLVYKWCEAHGGDLDSGAANPLDRVLTIAQATGSPAPVAWLCQQLDGCMVPNPALNGAGDELGSVLSATQRLVHQFSNVLSIVSLSYENDDQIDVVEATRIREKWESLKSVAERFVRACEGGTYLNGTERREGKEGALA